MKIALLLVFLLTLSGCAGLAMTGAGYNLGDIAPAKNSQVATTISSEKDAWGQNFLVMNTWHLQGGSWVLVSSHPASGAGIGQTALTAAAGSAPTAIALPIAAGAIRPSRTSVNQTNQDAPVTQGSLTNAPTSIVAPVQVQGQAIVAPVTKHCR